ncbi:hypothetical protein B0H13DRAFT_2395102 [Mycena leptocephala]|nr:hypothetical protein B0H13DRAFT_2395102 [Mycena leptocephala]
MHDQVSACTSSSRCIVPGPPHIAGAYLIFMVHRAGPPCLTLELTVSASQPVSSGRVAPAVASELHAQGVCSTASEGLHRSTSSSQRIALGFLIGTAHGVCVAASKGCIAALHLHSVSRRATASEPPAQRGLLANALVFTARRYLELELAAPASQGCIITVARRAPNQVVSASPATHLSARTWAYGVVSFISSIQSHLCLQSGFPVKNDL